MKIGKFEAQERQILLEKTSDLFAERGIKILTTEARIILHLLQNRQRSIKELMSYAGASYRGFYLTIERMKCAGIIAIENDKRDKRVRNVKLTQEAWELLPFANDTSEDSGFCTIGSATILGQSSMHSHDLPGCAAGLAA